MRMILEHVGRPGSGDYKRCKTPRRCTHPTSICLEWWWKYSTPSWCGVYLSHRWVSTAFCTSSLLWSALKRRKYIPNLENAKSENILSIVQAPHASCLEYLTATACQQHIYQKRKSLRTCSFEVLSLTSIPSKTSFSSLTASSFLSAAIRMTSTMMGTTSRYVLAGS